MKRGRQIKNKGAKYYSCGRKVRVRDGSVIPCPCDSCKR